LTDVNIPLKKIINECTHNLCLSMFCYFVSDPKVTGIRKPEAEGNDLALRVEQMDGFHDLTTYQYNIHTKVQNTIVGQCQANP
jgi:hypothetical protein